MSNSTPEQKTLLHEGEEVLLQHPALAGRQATGEGLLTLTNERLIWEKDAQKTGFNAVKGGVVLGGAGLVAGLLQATGSSLVVLPLSDIDSYEEPKKVFRVGAAINFVSKQGERYNFMIKNIKKISGEEVADNFMDHIKALIAK